jgi:hypothetical protein
MSERRMDAYYYGFDPTGVEAIDIILSAVACAGKAYHHTDQWTEDSHTYEDEHRGATPRDWIQNAASDAAKRYQDYERWLATERGKEAAARPDEPPTPPPGTGDER